MAEINLMLNGLKNRSDLHMARKIWHMAGVFMVFAGFSFLPYPTSMTLLGLTWMIFVPLDFVRQKNPKLNRSLIKLFRSVMRNSELNRLAGTTYLLSGILLCATFFNKGVVALSLLFLAFADPIASYIGIKYGKDKLFGHKSIQGFVAAFIVCTGLCLLFLFYNQIHEYILIVSLLAGLIGALAELIPVAKLDDNFTMPILSCIGLSVLFYFFGYFSYFS